jgi:outer membrane protein assembly factor BamB
MNDDFVTRLQFQLREAAEREARRGGFARAAQAARWRVASRPVLAGAALACVLALAITLATTLPTERDVPRPVEQDVPSGHDLRVVARAALVTQGGTIAPGFGAVWASDVGTGEVLRIDPRNRRVLARVAVGGQAFVNVGAGAVWASAGGRLIRIDPGTNRVTARVPLQLTERDFAAVFPGRGVMWVPTPLELLRVDPDRNAIDRRIELERNSFQARGFVSDGKLLYVLRGDRVLLVLDAATGATVSTTRLRLDGFLLGAADGAVLLETESGIVAVDSRSGRRLWREDIGAERVNYAFVAGGKLWTHVTDRETHRDRLLRLDLRDGRVTGSLTLPEFGVAGSAAVGDDIWIVSPSGRLLVVR